jgi:phospholipid transport system substrate-binding protein
MRALLLTFAIALLAGPLAVSSAVAEDAATDAPAEDAAPDSDVPNVEAREPVVTLEDTLLAVMKEADTLGFEGRLREIRPVVEATFDLEFMAKTSIGRVWKDLSPDLQTRWVEVFTRYTTTKLADQFDKYSGQRFVLKGERPASRGTLIVLSTVERPGKDDVRLDFRVRPMGDAWRIIDIYGKGKVSEVALRRSEYASILEQSGIEGLIASVDELSERTANKASS